MPVPALGDPSSASATTTLIAGALVLAEHDRTLRRLLAPEASELSARLLSTAGWSGMVRALGFGGVRAALRTVERFILPGIIPHYLARKRVLEATVRRSCSDEGGCQQVVVLGAGLDTLASRLHRTHPEVRWIEVDRPAALSVKATALAAAGIGENFVLAPVDLSEGSFWEALTLNGALDPTRRTLFIAEGLLMYLPWAQVEALFAETARSGHPAARWAFTFFEPRAGGGIGFRRSSSVVNRWLRGRGEPFCWAASEGEMAALLGRHGFAIRELWRADDLRERFLRPVGLGGMPLAEGEAVCVTDWTGGGS